MEPGEIAATARLPAWSDLFFIAQDADEVVGSIMAGFDGHQGWLYAMAVMRSHRRQRLGSALVKEAEARLGSMGCVKCGLQIGLANAGVVGFYASLGYAIEECISMEKDIADRREAQLKAVTAGQPRPHGGNVQRRF